MKTKSLLLMAALAAGAGLANAQITMTSQVLQQAVQHPGICEIDINGDGILDLIYTGEMRDGIPGRTYENADGDEVSLGDNTFQMVWNGTGYDIKEFPYYFGIKAYFAVADWNGDGLTDFITFNERSNADEGLFINNGNGTFTKTPITVVDENGDEITPFSPRTVDCADFNSDGLLDLVVTGWKDDGINGRRNYNYILINKGNNKFQAKWCDFLTAGGDGYELALNLTVATDLNNDGYAEFMTQGNVDNDDKPLTKNGVEVGRGFTATLNIGADGLDDGMPILYDLGLATGVAHQYGHGGFEVVDFNNDGVLDILVGGESPDDARAPGAWEYYWQLLQGRLDANGDVTYIDVTSVPFHDKDIRPLSDGSHPIRAIDYTGNGQYDLIMQGWCTGMLDGKDNTQCGWFFPNENGSFSSFQHVPGASEAGVFIYENGVSGARNYGFFGYTSDPMFTGEGTGFEGGRIMGFCNNPNAPAARPAAPASATATVDGYDVTLEWTAGAGNLNNVTYDYYIKDKGTGKYYRGITANADGVRTTVAQGRAFMAKKLNLNNLPDGDFEWGVQTVSASYQGSVFCKGNDFKVGNGSEGVEAVIDNTPVVATEYYDLAGRKLNNAPEQGIVIKKEIRESGASSVSKVVL